MQDSESNQPAAAHDPVVADELALLERVKGAIAEGSTRAAPSESAVVRELERLREQMLASHDPTDRAALSDQWNRQSSLLRQLQSARHSPEVRLDSPYFGHLRLREDGREWDLCLGKGTFIERGVTVVDWRNAPISRIFYRYRQGDEYEEDIAGRARTGEVAARRAVAIRDGALTRVDAPEGVFVAKPNAAGEWERVEHEPPRLAGGQGAALQVYRAAEGKQSRLGTSHLGAKQRADKHLPDIAGLIDPEQFRLISSPSSGLVVVRGTAGSGKTTVALHRIAYLAYDDPRIDSGADHVPRLLSGSARLRRPRPACTRRRPRPGSHLSGLGPRAAPPPLSAASARVARRRALDRTAPGASSRHAGRARGPGAARRGTERRRCRSSTTGAAPSAAEIYWRKS